MPTKARPQELPNPCPNPPIAACVNRPSILGPLSSEHLLGEVGTQREGPIERWGLLALLNYSWQNCCTMPCREPPLGWVASGRRDPHGVSRATSGRVRQRCMRQVYNPHRNPN